jgi:hypothetical protein
VLAHAEAVLEQLEAAHGLRSADLIVLTGNSAVSAMTRGVVGGWGAENRCTKALTDTHYHCFGMHAQGGFGVYSNADWLAERYPSARVVGAPIAGYEFFAWPYTGPGHTSSSLADFRQQAMGGGAYNRLWDSLVPARCTAGRRPPAPTRELAFCSTTLPTPLLAPDSWDRAGICSVSG